MEVFTVPRLMHFMDLTAHMSSRGNVLRVALASSGRVQNARATRASVSQFPASL